MYQSLASDLFVYNAENLIPHVTHAGIRFFPFGRLIGNN